jgi:uncharacterized membrane protein YqhA
MVIFTGYANFLRRTRSSRHPRWPAWITEGGFSSIKQKLLGTVVLIGLLTMLEVSVDRRDLSDVSHLGWLMALLLTAIVAILSLEY